MSDIDKPRAWNLSGKPLNETPRKWHGVGLGDGLALVNYVLKVSEKEGKTEKVYVGANHWVASKINEYLGILDTTGVIQIVTEHDPNDDFIEVPWNKRFTTDYCPLKNTWKPNSNKIISYQLFGRNGGGFCKKCSKKEKEFLEKHYSQKGYELRWLDVGKSLKECMDILAESEFYIGVDTGITHLALCSGIPIHLIRNCRSIVNIFHSYSHKAEEMNIYKNMQHFFRAHNDGESFTDGVRGSEQLIRRHKRPKVNGVRPRDEDGNLTINIEEGKYNNSHWVREIEQMFDNPSPSVSYFSTYSKNQSNQAK